MIELMRRRMVAQRALREVELLSAAERAELYEAVALILPEAEAEEARLTAFTIRESEQQQLKFRALLGPTPTERILCFTEPQKGASK